MDFSFTQDQIMIGETADAFLASVSDSASVRAAMSRESGFHNELWQQLTQQMAWQLTHIPADKEGLGLGYVELCILFEKMGKHLLCAPFFSTVAMGVNALLVAASAPQQAAILPQVARGECRLALAYANSGRATSLNGTDLAEQQPSYQSHADGYVLNGQYAYVIDGHTADLLIVAATSSEQHTELFLLDANTKGVSRQYTPSLDQTRKLAAISLNDVVVSADSLLANNQRHQALTDILSLAAIAMAAEQMAVAEQALNITVQYISQRQQFGRVIGSFQAIKHKAADMLNKAEAARSAVYYAACIADEYLQGGELASELHEAANIAKAYCCDAAYFNTGNAIQMHGGVGFTWEYDVHLYFKRAKSAQLLLGDSSWHRECIAQRLLKSTLGATP